MDVDGDAGLTVMQRGTESQLLDYLHSREQCKQDEVDAREESWNEIGFEDE